MPGGLVADALGAVTGIESKTVIGANQVGGYAAGRPCLQLRAPQVADRRPGGQTSASRSIRPDLAFRWLSGAGMNEPSARRRRERVVRRLRR